MRNIPIHPGDYFRAALLILLASCQTSPAPLITETDGSAARIPDSSTKAVVWGDEPEAIKSLKTWLLKRRLTLIDEAKVRQIATEVGLNHALSNADVLKSAKLAGAKQVIFVDAAVSRSRTHEFFGQSLYEGSIYIRALDVDSGEINWNGKARSAQSYTSFPQGIDQLTCHVIPKSSFSR